jgi:hypothetical protein
LKITFLAPHIRIAGGVRAILTYADRLAGRGHEGHTELLMEMTGSPPTLHEF